MILILLGAPGSGKGTIARMMVEEYGIPQVSTGDILRSAAQAGTALGLQAKAFMDRGELVPDELVIGLVEQRIRQEECRPGFIMDGFPRTIAQAGSFDGMLDRNGRRLCAAVNVDVPFDVIVKRIAMRRTCANTACQAVYNLEFSPPRQVGICDLCGSPIAQRDDEREDVVQNRLDVYRSKTAPLIAYYDARQALGTFRGTDSRVIFEDARAWLAGRC